MKSVSPNIFMLAMTLIVAPVFAWAIGLSIRRFIINEYVHELAIFFIGIFFFTIFFMFAFLPLLGIWKIKYDVNTGEIKFYRLFKSRTIFISDIKEYYRTKLTTKWKDYKGVILLLANGDSIELTEFNLKSLIEFKGFVVKSKVPCRAEIKSWYPFKRRLRTTVCL